MTIRLAITVMLLLTIAVVGVAHASGVPAVFIDVNDNGIYDAGDVDVTAQLRDSGIVSTPYSIVVAGAVRAVPWTELDAGNKITVLRGLYGSELTLSAGDAVAIADRAVVSVTDYLDVLAGGTLSIGRATLQADNVMTLEGTLVQMSGATLRSNAVGVRSSGPEVANLTNVRAIAPTTAREPGSIDFEFYAPAQITGGSLYAAGGTAGQGLVIAASVGELDVDTRITTTRGGIVVLRVFEPQNGAESVLDVTGTTFRNVSVENLSLDAAHVIGY